MQPAVLIRLRPAGPWRFGPGDGGASRTDSLFRSDRLFAALTVAAKQLGFGDEWLHATAQNGGPAVALSSLYPFQGDVLFVTPPANVWPPPHGLVTSPSPVFLTKVRWSAANFVPVSLVEAILTGQKVLADQWTPDPESGCLLRRDRPSSTPFRTVLRTGAAVDRIRGESSVAHTFAGVEFEPGAGLWTAVRFADEGASSAWGERIEGMFRLLADTGLGGRRSVGWGQMQAPEFERGRWPDVVFPKIGRALSRSGGANESDTASNYWLLSLYSPKETDAIDWTGGDYQLIERTTLRGKRLRMVAEGSVLSASVAPVGRAIDVADAGQQPVYRFGLALALKLPSAPEPVAEEVSIEAEPTVEPEPTLEPEERFVPEPVEGAPDIPEDTPRKEPTAELPPEERFTAEPAEGAPDIPGIAEDAAVSEEPATEISPEERFTAEPAEGAPDIPEEPPAEPEPELPPEERFVAEPVEGSPDIPVPDSEHEEHEPNDGKEPSDAV